MAGEIVDPHLNTKTVKIFSTLVHFCFPAHNYADKRRLGEGYSLPRTSHSNSHNDIPLHNLWLLRRSSVHFRATSIFSSE